MSDFWTGLGGFAAGASRGLDRLLALAEAEARRKQQDAQFKATMDFNVRRAAEEDRVARAERLQRAQQFVQQQELNRDQMFGQQASAMNVGTLDPGALRRELYPSHIPELPNISLPMAGDIPLKAMGVAADRQLQDAATGRRAGFSKAYAEAAQRGQSTQRDVPIEGFDAAYVSQKFNPNTGAGSMYNAGINRDKLSADLVNQTMRSGMNALRAAPEINTLRDLFANPATKEQAITRAREMAQAAMRAQWSAYQSLMPELSTIPFDDSWVVEVLGEGAGGRPVGPPAGGPKPMAPDALQAMLDSASGAGQVQADMQRFLRGK